MEFTKYWGIYFILLHFANAGTYVEMIKAVMKYYESRSVIFVINENKSEINFLKMRKEFFFNDNLYFVSYINSEMLFEVMRREHHGGKQTVVVLEQNEQFLNGSFALASNEIDISSYKWLVLTETYNLKCFDKIKIPLTTEFIIAHGNLDNYTLTEIYDAEPDRKLSKNLGNWVSGNLRISYKSLYQRRKNLEKGVIKIVSTSKDPCNAASFALGVWTIVLCVNKLILDAIANMLNASTDIIVVANLDVHTIKNVNADLTLRSAPMNTEHLDTRSYTWPTFGTKLEVVASYIGQDTEWKTFIRPFSYGMWLVIFCWILIGDLALALAEFTLFMFQKNRKSLLSYYGKYSFLSTFAFCNQGVADVPKPTICRIIFFMMFAVPTVLVPGYSGVLTSFITVQLPKMPFRNLEELSRREDYNLGWHKSFPFQMMFKPNDTNPVNQALLANNVFPEDKLPETDEEAIEKMCNGKFSFISDMNTIIALRPKCKYYKLDHPFLVVFTAIELKKNLSHRDFINHCLRDIQSSGLFERSVVHVVMKFLRPSDFIQGHSEEISPIMMENCVLPFAVLLFSMSISGLVFLMEIIWFKKKEESQNISLTLNFPP